ncbi:MAG: hypothetical protein ACO3OO_12055, partial [Gemmobacter sp.]
MQSAASIDLTLNRAGVGDGASLSFKTGYAADAILGTGGSGDLTLKSGPGFIEALRVGRLGGRVRMARARAGAWPDAVGRNRVLGRGWSAVGGLEGAGWRGLSWAEDLGLLCAVAASDGDGGGAVALSADGLSWTRHPAAGPESWAAVARGRGVFVALAEAGEGPRAMTSADGRVWTAREVPARGWAGVAYAPELGLFAAVARGGTGNRAMTSADGIAWTLRSTEALAWRGVVWAADLGLFVAVASGGTGPRVMTSADGVVWARVAAAPEAAWSGVAFGPGVGLVAVAEGGE